MTGVLSSRPPGASAAPPAVEGRPLVVAGALAAGYAAGLGLLATTLPVLLGWVSAADTSASASEAVSASAQAWLLAHGAVLDVPHGTFGLVPLGLTVLPAVLLHLAGFRAARASEVVDARGVLSLTGVVAGCYALLACGLTIVATTSAVHARPVSAFLGSALVAAAAAGSGAMRAAGGKAVLSGLPPGARLALRGGAAGLAVLIAGGALVSGLSLAAHLGRAADLADGLDTGAVGGVLLLVVCVLYVPTAAVWGAAFAVGPGFAVGTGTAVGLTGSTLGSVPGLPLLAALPQHGSGPGALLAVLVPLAAGVAAGVVVSAARGREGDRGAASWRQLVTLGFASGGVTGALFAVLCVAASGAAGPGRMADVGPSFWVNGLLAAVEVGTVAAATLAVRSRGRA